MKKVFLSVVALMFGVVAFAQTTTTSSEADLRESTSATPSTIDTSTIENADALPAAGVQANTGYSEQNGNNNSMKARTAGDKNSIVGFQNGNGNLVSIRQTGDTNNSGTGIQVSAIENQVQSNQIGDQNDGRIEQQGDYNDVQLLQINDTPGAVGNSADIQQGNAQQAENNYAGVEQYGTDNSAKILQTWDNSDAFVKQGADFPGFEGRNNTVEIKQQADPEDSEGQEALVEQYGEDNQGLIEQLSDGSRGRNYARLYQEGNNNMSSQTQTTTDDIDGNEALVNQGGNVLFSDADSQANFGIVNSVDNVANGVEDLDSHYSQAIQVQSGERNLAESHQFGDGNSIDNGDYTKQTQDGEDNQAFAFQNVFGSPTGRGNSAEQTQIGDGNYIATGQNGRRNDMTITQEGDDNYAVSTQRGRDHVLDVLQTGPTNAVETAQRGDMNSIVIRQNGDLGQSWKALQNVPEGLPNGGNSLDVYQTTGFFGDLPAIGTSQTANAVARDAVAAPVRARSGSDL